MYVCMYVYTVLYVCMYVCICMYILYMCIYKYIYEEERINVSKDSYMHACVNVCIKGFCFYKIYECMHVSVCMYFSLLVNGCDGRLGIILDCWGDLLYVP